MNANATYRERALSEYAYCRWIAQRKPATAAQGADGTLNDDLWAQWLIERETFTAALKRTDEAIFQNWSRSVKTQRELRQVS